MRLLSDIRMRLSNWRTAPRTGLDTQQAYYSLIALLKRFGVKVGERTITVLFRNADEWVWCRRRISLEKDSGGISSAQRTEQGREAASSELKELESLKEDELALSLPTSDLLIRIMTLPATTPAEIEGMVGFQMDKVSPFPQDQLNTSFEILQQDEEDSVVLMAGVRQSVIDELGATYSEAGLQIHRIDARLLGWLKLLSDNGHTDMDACELILIDDDSDLSLVVLNGGQLVAVRSLDAKEISEASLESISTDISYTLIGLDAELELPPVSRMGCWAHGELDEAVLTGLSERCGIEVEAGQLSDLPSLSDGLMERAVAKENLIELVPPEWIERVKQKKMQHVFIRACSVILALWLCVMMVSLIVFKVRDMKLQRVKNELAAIEPAGKAALEDREKLKALKVYTDRSHSALECLREVTDYLPNSNIEFASFNYKKGKGVTLRGSAAEDEFTYDFFKSLTQSDLFSEVMDESVNARVVKGIRNSVFSVTLGLPVEEVEP